MIANVNPNTGVAYGVIAATSLQPEILMMIENSGVNRNEEYAKAELEAELDRRIEAGSLMAYDRETAYQDGIAYWYDNDAEPLYHYVEHTEDGKVEVNTTWLGGALLVYFIETPYTVRAELCSPCCPNAGDLDSVINDSESTQGVICYDAPPSWRNDDDAELAVIDIEDDEVETMSQELDALAEEAEPTIYRVDLQSANATPRAVWAVTQMVQSVFESWLKQRGVAFIHVTSLVNHPADVDVLFDLPEEENDFMVTTEVLNRD